MAIWMDDIENETGSRWQVTDIALTVCLATVVFLQAAVVFYLFDVGGVSRTIASTEGAAHKAAISAVVPEIEATEFSAKVITPDFVGYSNSAGPAFWFRPGEAVGHVDLSRSANAIIVPTNFAFNANGMSINLRDVPLDYRTTEPVEPVAAETAIAASAPKMNIVPITPVDAIDTAERHAALADYFGQKGLVAMGKRCGAILDQAFKYDGGLIALCHEVRATL